MVKRYYEVGVQFDFGLVEVEVEFSSDDPMPTENEIHDAACEVIKSALSNSKLESYRRSEWIRAEDEDLRLMAAAPEMLKMLDEIALQIRRGQDISGWYSEITDIIEKAKPDTAGEGEQE